MWQHYILGQKVLGIIWPLCCCGGGNVDDGIKRQCAAASIKCSGVPFHIKTMWEQIMLQGGGWMVLWEWQIHQVLWVTETTELYPFGNILILLPPIKRAKNRFAKSIKIMALIGFKSCFRFKTCWPPTMSAWNIVPLTAIRWTTHHQKSSSYHYFLLFLKYRTEFSLF